MKPPTRVRLVKDLSRHLHAGHPWVWRDALAPASVPTGTIVDVIGKDNAFIARGLWDADSPIAVRVYTLDDKEALDGDLVSRRVIEALASRRGGIDFGETNAFRLLNGEGDGLPGVVVDVYDDTAILKLDGEAARTLCTWVASSVIDALRSRGVERVYERARGGFGSAIIGGDPPDTIEIKENGVRFAVDVKRGQKTGTFLDQRENRRAIRPYCSDAIVANLFSYTGGFSVHAALAGARRVTSVDSAAPALACARDNFALNGLSPDRHSFDCLDVFTWLARARAEGARYDVLIVDPPSFAPSEKSLEKALAAYRDLFAASLGVIVPGGILAASSCSSHVDQEAFIGTLREAAVRARRPLRLLEVRGQPADHPTTPAFKEGRYLKFIIARAR